MCATFDKKSRNLDSKLDPLITAEEGPAKKSSQQPCKVNEFQCPGEKIRNVPSDIFMQLAFNLSKRRVTDTLESSSILIYSIENNHM